MAKKTLSDMASLKPGRQTATSQFKAWLASNQADKQQPLNFTTRQPEAGCTALEAVLAMKSDFVVVNKMLYDMRAKLHERMQESLDGYCSFGTQHH